jgi:hypothetical protein
MPFTFANGSSVSVEKLSWNMWYPWPPFYQEYRDEPGLRIRFSKKDADRIGDALAAAMRKAPRPVAAALGAFAGIVPTIADRLLRNRDGTIDVRISEHGFQVGTAPAADPNAWLQGLWRPVGLALSRLPMTTPPPLPGAGGTPMSLRQINGDGAAELPAPDVLSRGELHQTEVV